MPRGTHHGPALWAGPGVRIAPLSEPAGLVVGLSGDVRGCRRRRDGWRLCGHDYLNKPVVIVVPITTATMPGHTVFLLCG